RYRELFELHLFPDLGSRPLNHISKADGIALQAALVKGGVGSVTVRHAMRLGRAFLDAMVAWRVISTNPFAGVPPARLARRERAWISELRTLSETELPTGTPILDLLHVAHATGLRRGELLALCWKNVDLASGCLYITGSLEHLKKRVRFKATK